MFTKSANASGVLRESGDNIYMGVSYKEKGESLLDPMQFIPRCEVVERFREFELATKVN